MFWLELWQLWSEAKPSRLVMHTVDGIAYIPPADHAPRADVPEMPDVIIVSEKQEPQAR
jgi:hypothetical protein